MRTVLGVEVAGSIRDGILTRRTNDYRTLDDEERGNDGDVYRIVK